MRKEYNYKNWSVTYSPEDGARLNRLSFKGFDLLTTEPEKFKPPRTNYGQFETRPVYGYDDCFPSVDSCVFPGLDWTVPDHGELCWLKWQVVESPDRLSFSVKSETLPVLFKREMHFTENVLIWIFNVCNEGKQTLPFMHVMHPLMPLREIEKFDLPAFGSVFDEIKQKKLNFTKPGDIENYLLKQSVGTAQMLLLQQVENGVMSLFFKNGLNCAITFPVEIFPTVGIWWNNLGYPDEDGCRRNECAFEPIPGSTSVLAEAYHTGTCPSILPGQCLSWQINWKMNR